MSEDLRRDAAGGSHSSQEPEVAVTPNVPDDTWEDISNEGPKVPPRRQRAASCDSMSCDGNISVFDDPDSNAYLSSGPPSRPESDPGVDFVKQRLLNADEYFQELDDLRSQIFDKSMFEFYTNGKIGKPFDGTIRFETTFLENASFQTSSFDYIVGFCQEVALTANEDAMIMDSISTDLSEWGIQGAGEHYINHRMHDRTIEHLVHLIDCRNVITAVWEGVKQMRSAAFCGEFISLLVLDRTRRGVARLARIECSKIEKLALAFESCVFRVLSSDPVAVLFDTISTIANDVSAACRQLLTDLDISISSTADLKDHWRCAVHVLDVAVLSYSGAHTEFLGNEKVTSVSLPGAFLENQYFRFCRRSFSCLGEFLGRQEAWVLEMIHPDLRQTNPTHLSLLTDSKTFGDIWGPMWKSCVLGNEEQIIEYNVGNGVILPWKQPSPTVLEVRKDEVFCHWMSDKDYRDHKGFADSSYLHENDALLIGATVRLAANIQCKLSTTEQEKTLRNSGALSEPGTVRNGRTLSSEVFQVQVGAPYGNLVHERQYKRKGQTLKKSLIEDWKRRPLTRFLEYLEFNLGLEVSTCTHNARRIRLIKLLGTQTMLNHLRRYSKWNSTDCEEQFYSVLQDPDHTAFRRLYQSNPDWQTDLGNAVEYCLNALVDTGKNENYLELFWVPDDKPGLEVFLKSSELSWIHFLAETETSGTLAVLEDRCLELRSSNRGKKCQNAHSETTDTSEKLSTFRDDFNGSILETSVELNRLCVPDSIGQGLIPSARRDGNPPRHEYRWSVSRLRKGDKFYFGTKGYLEVIEPLDQAGILAKWSKIPDILQFIKNIEPGGRKVPMEHYECIRKENQMTCPVQFFIISTRTNRLYYGKPSDIASLHINPTSVGFGSRSYTYNLNKDGDPRNGMLTPLPLDEWGEVLRRFSADQLHVAREAQANMTQLSVDSDRPYKCIFCRHTFSRSDVLKRHFQKCSISRGNLTDISESYQAQTHLMSKEEASIYAENPTSRIVPAFGKKVDMQKVNMEFLKKWIVGKIQDILGAGVDIHHPAIQEFFVEIERNRFLDIKPAQIVLHKLLGAETLAFCEEFWQLCRSNPSNSQGSPKELLAGRKLELAQGNNSAGETVEEAPQSVEAAEHDCDLGSLELLETQFQEESRTDWSTTGDSGIPSCNENDCEPAYVSDNLHSRKQCLEADQYAERSSNDSALSDGESTDTGSPWMSDYSDVYLLGEDHPFNLIKPTVVREGLLAYQNAKQQVQAGSSTNATSGTPNSALGAKDGITTQPKKRCRKNQDGSEDAGDSEDDEGFTAKRRRTSKKAAGNQPSFACPFAKKDSLKFRGCYAYVLNRVRDVKQHLYRFHQRPIYCPRCTHTFETEDERDEHIRASPCLIQQQPITFEGVTRAQKTLLGRRVSAKMTPSDQWFTIFDILFPGHTPRPKSAYINTELTVELEAFQDLMYTIGPRLISSTIRSIGLDISAIENVEEDSAALLQSAIQDGLQQVSKIWLENMPGSQQESSNSKLTTTGGSSTFPACHGIQGSEALGSSSNILVEDIQERNVTAEQNFSFEEYDRYQDHALPQGISSNSEVMVADASTLFLSNTDLQSSNPISNVDIQPVILDEDVIRDPFRPGSHTEDSWKAIENGNLESGGSWNLDAAFNEARGM